MKNDSMDAQIDARPTLKEWLGVYEDIEDDFVGQFESQGVIFEKRDEKRIHDHALREKLKAAGARFLNDGASISTGFISSACEACVGDCASRTFYLNLVCNKNCYFCFNPNQYDYERHCFEDTLWREDLHEFTSSDIKPSHIALTGGEPLLFPAETLEFFEQAHEESPDSHLRLYTSGTGLDDELCKQLADEGLQEIRFSIKIEDGQVAVDEGLRAIDIAKKYIPDVMVEMPVPPGMQPEMESLLQELDKRDVRGINLLEFCFPLHNWPEFEKRGYKVKNPPFDILYDYGYAGGLPIAGSEEACLELMVYAMDNNLSLGIHYCSLKNKNIDQVLQQNSQVRLDPSIYRLSENGFWTTAKVFDQDVNPVAQMLRALGYRCEHDFEGTCLLFHTRHYRAVESAGYRPAISSNTLIDHDGGWAIRELGLTFP
ncbi:MAG: radical SAM protein [Eggerthellaceae bacterium]|nr:radical SAM protein [Eggerthellaceae bacterium]